MFKFSAIQTGYFAWFVFYFGKIEPRFSAIGYEVLGHASSTLVLVLSKFLNGSELPSSLTVLSLNLEKFKLQNHGWH